MLAVISICAIIIRNHLTNTIFVWSGQIYNIVVVILMCTVTYLYTDYNICYSIYNKYYV